jgi:hypothetical protein
MRLEENREEKKSDKMRCHKEDSSISFVCCVDADLIFPSSEGVSLIAAEQVVELVEFNVFRAF